MEQKYINEIHEECKKLASRYSKYFTADFEKFGAAAMVKLANNLHVPSGVMLTHHFDLSNNCDQGFIVADGGIYTCEKSFGIFGSPTKTSWEWFRNARDISYKSGITSSKIAVDGRVIAHYYVGTNRQAEEELVFFFDRIVSIARDAYR